MKDLFRRVRSIDTVSELLDTLTFTRLERVSKWLLFVLVVSPFYAMGRSLFFEHHTSEAYLGNLLAVGRVWQLLIRQLGYLGLIIGVILIAKAFLNKKRQSIALKAFIKSHLIETFFLSFLIVAFVSTLASPNTALAWNGAFYRREGFETYLAYAGLFSMALTLRKTSGLFLIRVFVGVAFILTLFSFIDSPYLNRLLTLKASTAIFHNPNHYGYYLLLALMMNFALLLKLGKAPIESVIGFGLSFILITHIIIINRTFGVFIALCTGLLISLAVVFWLKRAHFKKALALALLFTLVSVLSSLPTGYLSGESETLSEDVTSVVTGDETRASAGSGRWSLWTHAVMFATERPLLGYGPDNLGARYAETGHNTDRPHNEIIQFSASLGFPAALLYISGVVTLAHQAFKHRRYLSIETLGTGFTVTAYLVSSMFGNTMFYTTPFYLFVFALTYAFIKQDSHAFENSRV